MKRFFVLILFVSFSFIANAQVDPAIQQVLKDQTTAWNKGDITAFMQTYWKNDSLLFVSPTGITHGWQEALDRYKIRYPNTDAMGKLDFTIVREQRIDAEYYFVVGKWHLARKTGSLRGTFTLLFKKISGQWKIICDHSD